MGAGDSLSFQNREACLVRFPFFSPVGERMKGSRNSWGTADPECQKRQIRALKSWEIVTEMNHPCSGGNG